jgi:eukaryotic-like serine/threonine-protein kinase
MSMKPLKPNDPRAFGDIVVHGRLGEGGMGTVYFGLTPEGARVAVKTIRADLTANEEARDRFDREILVLGMVGGPRIAALITASDDPGQDADPWLATEYIQGLTLTEYVQERGPLDLPMTAALGLMLAEGLTDIHRAGLLHRDLKPSNVILGPDGPRVIDFGLAGLAEGTSDITHSSGLIGTPVCMAPEQATSPRHLTEAVDVHALGAVLMFAVTGRFPYQRPTVPALLIAIADPAADPDLAGLPGELSPLIRAMLAHHPQDRPGLPEVATELLKILNDAGFTLTGAQSALAGLTYIERDSDPPPAPPAASRARARRLPGEPQVPSDLVARIAEKVRHEYARGAAL